MENKVYTKQTNCGILRSDKPPKTYVMIYNLITVLGAIILLLAIVLLFNEDTIEFVPGILPMAALFVVLGLYGKKKILKEYDIFMESVREKIKKDEEARLKYQEEHPYPDGEKLYTELRKIGVTDLESKANLSRLKLCAKNNGINMSDKELIKQFNLGKESVERLEAKALEAEKLKYLNELKKQELELNANYTRYAKFRGLNKSIQYCQDHIDEAKEILRQCEEDTKSVYNGGEALYLSGKQKESSWAIHGGIANGIAGGAAGVAVALDVERRNHEKRQQNQQLLENVAAMSVQVLNKIWDRKSKATKELEYWQEKLVKTKNLLTEKVDATKLIEMMHPMVEDYEITETGAVKLKVSLSAAKDLFICDDVFAVVDGSVKVLIKVGNKNVGTAICTLPHGGLVIDCTLDCICCEPKETAVKYTFDFAPNNLWALEHKSLF